MNPKSITQHQGLRPTQRVPDPQMNTSTVVVGVAAFSGSFLTQSWLRQSSFVSSQPRADWRSQAWVSFTG
jgi:hypothetical protein